MTLQKQELIQYFRKGEKSLSRHSIGLEHEIFLYDSAERRLAYPEIRTILEAFVKKGWTGIFENDNLIAAQNAKGAKITLEPGGQFELSGAPLPNLHQVSDEFHTYHKTLQEILDTLGIHKKFLGFEPVWPRDQIPWMPKERYNIMKAYLPTRGTKAHDMMLRTCTVQGNFDYTSEEDMVRKMRISVALQPLITALFANSATLEGKPSGFQSYRASVWQDTDPDRCGFLDFVFDQNMGYERYVDYLLSIPMFFIYRNGVYHSAAGASFIDYMNGRLPHLQGFTAQLSDWEDQTTIAFPEVRLKQYIEMRGADCVPPPKILALPAFWTGILYDQDALSEIESLIKSWAVEEMRQTSLAVPKEGLQRILAGKTLEQWAALILPIAKTGLKRRAILNEKGEDESIYLVC